MTCRLGPVFLCFCFRALLLLPELRHRCPEFRRPLPSLSSRLSPRGGVTSTTSPEVTPVPKDRRLLVGRPSMGATSTALSWCFRRSLSALPPRGDVTMRNQQISELINSDDKTLT